MTSTDWVALVYSISFVASLVLLRRGIWQVRHVVASTFFLGVLLLSFMFQNRVNTRLDHAQDISCQDRQVIAKTINGFHFEVKKLLGTSIDRLEKVVEAEQAAVEQGTASSADVKTYNANVKALADLRELRSRAKLVSIHDCKLRLVRAQ